MTNWRARACADAVEIHESPRAPRNPVCPPHTIAPSARTWGRSMRVDQVGLGIVVASLVHGLQSRARGARLELAGLMKRADSLHLVSNANSPMAPPRARRTD